VTNIQRRRRRRRRKRRDKLHAQDAHHAAIKFSYSKHKGASHLLTKAIVYFCKRQSSVLKNLTLQGS